jgi:hypothetical protein
MPFSEKNPLTFVKPLTINVYFKQQVPCVGSYDPKLPISNHARHGYKRAFKPDKVHSSIKPIK